MDNRSRGSSGGGFTLIELLMVLVTIGILAAISIPSYIHAVHRGKQKRTMSDMRSLGTAVESYQADNGFVPRVASGEASVLEPFLRPVQTVTLPSTDGWGNAVRWEHVPGADPYSLVSRGKDASPDAAPPALGATTSFDADIYFADGVFTVWPEGSQR